MEKLSGRKPHATEITFFCSLFLLGTAALYLPGHPEHLWQLSTFTFSNWCGLLIVAFSLLETVRSVKVTSASPPDRESASLLTGIFCALLVAYAAALHWTSYYLATGLFIPAALLLLGAGRSALHIVLIPLLWLLFVYVVFEKLFSIVLPVMS